MFVKKQLNPLVSVVTFLTLLGLVVAPVAQGKIAVNTIDATSKLSENGRRLVVTGPIQTDVVERIYLRVTVTQRTTGAVAEGIAILRGTGALQHWEVQARTRGKASFEPGAATAVAIGITGNGGNTSDAHQWLVNITLETK